MDPIEGKDENLCLLRYCVWVCAYECNETGIGWMNELHIYEKSHERRIQNVHESENILFTFSFLTF